MSVDRETSATREGEVRATPAPPERGSATTQIGAVTPPPIALPPRPAPAERRNRYQRAPEPPRERVTALITALGDPAHPLHAVAVDELAALGPAVIPALNEVLTASHPWLTVYRAADVAGRLADGRASGGLARALHHPNSNVRWNAVRALAQIGDVRALIELRRVANGDQGRTSWGESVADVARSALDQINTRSIWGQGLELIKTAVSAVLMVLALVFAFSVITTVRDDLDRFGLVPPDRPQGSELLPTLTATAPLPTSDPLVAVEIITPTLDLTPVATAVSGVETVQTGTVLQAANIRPQPNTSNDPIGRLAQNDEVIFLARSPDSQWFLIRLGTRRADASAINNPDGSSSGWINRALVTPPSGDLPVQGGTPTPNP